MAAAVVKEPAGSAKVEHSNGDQAFLAASSMSRATMASLPPKRSGAHAVRSGGEREDASWIRGRNVRHFDVGVGDDDFVAGVGGHVHVERADVLARGRACAGWALLLVSSFWSPRWFGNSGSGGADDGAGIATLHNFQIEPVALASSTKDE